MRMLIKEHAACPHFACLLLLATSLMHSQLSPWREKALLSLGCLQPRTHTQQCCLVKHQAKFGFSFYFFSPASVFLEKFTLKSTSLPDIHICFIMIEAQRVLTEVVPQDTAGGLGLAVNGCTRKNVALKCVRCDLKTALCVTSTFK